MGNDYIAAYPPVCATSDRGDGKMRITWPAWGLDRVLLAALTTSHYVANVSLVTPESAAILATGGTEGGGFWIDVDKTYAGSTWLNTHCYSPQRQSTVYHYTSFNLARAAMISANNNDNMFLGDFGSTVMIGTAIWSPSPGIIAGSCWGIRANQQNGVVSSAGATDFFRMEGDLSTTGAATWQNLTMMGGTYNRGLFWWRPTSGTAGGALTLSRIIYSGSAGCFFTDVATVTLATGFVINECIITGCLITGIGFGSGTGAGTTVSHCTIGMCLVSGIANASKTVTYTNNLVFDCATCYATKTNGTYTKCAATDATGSEAGLNSLTRTQLAFWNEKDNGCFDAGYGILTTSVLYHAGADTADTTDIKGLARHATTPSIGAYEGTVNAFGVAWPTAGQVLKSAGAFQQFSGATTPTYNDDNLADGNVRPVAYGVGHTGDLANLAPTDAAYIALEATAGRNQVPDLAKIPSVAGGGPAAWNQLGVSRIGTRDLSLENVDPGVAYVVREADGGPASYKILNATKTPAFNLAAWGAAYEADRNTDPGVAHVEDGVDYKIYGTDLEGEFAGGGAAAAFDVRLSAAVVAVGGTVTVTGGVTLTAAVVGAAVTLRRYKKSDDSLIATTVNAAAVDFSSGVQKTWAQIAGAAVTFTPAAAQEEYLVAAVTGGTPAVTDESSGRFPCAVVPAFTAPALAVADDGDGSVTCTVTNNAGQTSRLKYRHSAASAWTVHGTSLTGNGSITDLTGLLHGAGSGAYIFQLVPYDAVTGLEGPASAAIPLHLADSTAAATTSALDEEMEAVANENLDAMGVDVTYTPLGLTPVELKAILGPERSTLAEGPEGTLVTRARTFQILASAASGAGKDDSFTWNGHLWPAKAPPVTALPWVIFDCEEAIDVRTAASASRKG